MHAARSAMSTRAVHTAASRCTRPTSNCFPGPVPRYNSAAGLCEHLQVQDRQSTSAQSQFLDACRSRNRGDLEAAQLAEAMVRLGFANVIDAFHVSRGDQPTQTRFFADER